MHFHTYHIVILFAHHFSFYSSLGHPFFHFCAITTKELFRILLQYTPFQIKQINTLDFSPTKDFAKIHGSLEILQNEFHMSLILQRKNSTVSRFIIRGSRRVIIHYLSNDVVLTVSTQHLLMFKCCTQTMIRKLI